VNISQLKLRSERFDNDDNDDDNDDDDDDDDNNNIIIIIIIIIIISGFARRNRGLFNSNTGPGHINKKQQEIYFEAAKHR
jgi:hypothetical protein